MQHRHRRRRRGSEQPKKAPPIKLIAALVAMMLVFIAGQKTLTFFGVGNAKRVTAAVLQIEPGGVVNVSVEGGPMKRAETDVKLYSGDSVVTSPRNFARLDTFDGTTVRIDESTQLNIMQSYEGEENSAITLDLPEGGLWIATPKLLTYSGAITRTIQTPYLSAVIPSQAEVVMTPRSIAVFAADGLGLSVTVAGNDQTVVVGEGQQFTLPPGGEQNGDLYVHRSPLSTDQLQSEFVEKSRALYAGAVERSTETTATEEVVVDDGIILSVTNPEDGATIETATLTVTGRIGKDVEKVRINGYLADVDFTAKTFTEELALPEEDQVNITIEAIDDSGVVIAEALRKVSRDRKPPEAPQILSPAGNGATYSTTGTEIEISGKAPQGAVGIIVNDYRLQLFKPGDTEWSYLANTEFNNMKVGKNVYEVVAINRGGYRSEPAVITVVLDPDGHTGLVNQEATGNADSSSSTAVAAPTTVEESNLPTNLPLMPGSISIYAPAAGTEFTTSNSENLIEGNVPVETHSVWVNGYRLQLYEPGKNFFNYIASVELNTLKRGRNAYRITIRSDEGYILDELTYVITFQP